MFEFISLNPHLGSFTKRLRRSYASVWSVCVPMVAQQWLLGIPERGSLNISPTCCFLETPIVCVLVLSPAVGCCVCVCVCVCVCLLTEWKWQFVDHHDKQYLRQHRYNGNNMLATTATINKSLSVSVCLCLCLSLSLPFSVSVSLTLIIKFCSDS